MIDLVIILTVIGIISAFMFSMWMILYAIDKLLHLIYNKITTLFKRGGKQ